jgi:hypothetical protein
MAAPSLTRRRHKLNLILVTPARARDARRRSLTKVPLTAESWGRLVAFQAAVEAWTGRRVDPVLLVETAIAQFLKRHRTWEAGPGADPGGTEVR